MAEPEDIVRAALEVLGRAEVLRGRKVLVTAGGTREPLDPVRFITNRSTGKMGYALAETAKEMGAEVVLISAPTHLEPPPGVEVVNVTTAEDMYGEVMARAPLADAVVMAAAVADFTPAKFSGQKIKKEGKDTLTLELRRTRDILEELGKRKGRGQVLVGFAAETSGLREKGRDKLRSKNLDMLVANDVSSRHTGFASDYNRALLLFENGEERETDVMPKRDLAALIWKEVSRLLEQAAERASQG
jgi:phosphopantothenoylcysteine decarboxylase/phosphopantothenate--cysteine ligase